MHGLRAAQRCELVSQECRPQPLRRPAPPPPNDYSQIRLELKRNNADWVAEGGFVRAN